jgi:predicted Mrr-cat superfamily restriction endonuclease
MAENDEEAVKDLEESVVRMNEMSQISGQVYSAQGYYRNNDQEDQIIDQEDGLDALFDKNGNKIAKRKYSGKKIVIFDL